MMRESSLYVDLAMLLDIFDAVIMHILSPIIAFISKFLIIGS